MTEVASEMSTTHGSVEHEPRPRAAKAFPIAAGLWVALLLAGFLPLLIRFGTDQWYRPHYQFFPLMIVAAAYVGWQRLQEMPVRHFAPGSRLLSRVLLGLGLVILVAAAVAWVGRLAAVATLIALTGATWRFGGLRVVRALAPSGVLLALIIGPPDGITYTLLQSLREWAVLSSSVALVWLHIPHLMTGTVIEIAGSRLLVAEACSGINSMMAVLGFTLVLGFIRRRSPAVTAILALTGVVFVLWANMVRIAGGAWLKSVWDIDILSGDVHTWASLVLCHTTGFG